MAKRNPGPMWEAGGGKETYHDTNEKLADREAEVLLRTEIDWEKLRPEVGDSDLYDRLITEVKKATKKNEGLARLKERLQELGEKGLKLAKEVVKLVS